METIQQTQRVRGVQTQTASRSGTGLLWMFVRKPKRTLAILIILVALALLTFFALRSESPEEKAQKKLAVAVASVGELMILPEGDEPVLATVTDAKALTAQQAFFSGSVNGDQLLLFPRSLKAVIYSPSRDKIINAGPIEQQPGAVVDKSQTTNPKSQIPMVSHRGSSTAVGTSSNDPDSAKASTGEQNSNDLNTITVEVRNGTGKTGYATQFAEELEANAGYTVVEVTDAGKKNYQNTLVYVRTGDKSNQSKVDALTTSLGVATIDSLPDGEKTTSADVLVILGMSAKSSAQAGDN